MLSPSLVILNPFGVMLSEVEASQFEAQDKIREASVFEPQDRLWRRI
jgi:hypothetical protein